jgi:hypothetical protein
MKLVDRKLGLLKLIAFVVLIGFNGGMLLAHFRVYGVRFDHYSLMDMINFIAIVWVSIMYLKVIKHTVVRFVITLLLGVLVLVIYFFGYGFGEWYNDVFLTESVVQFLIIIGYYVVYEDKISIGTKAGVAFFGIALILYLNYFILFGLTDLFFTFSVLHFRLFFVIMTLIFIYLLPIVESYKTLVKEFDSLYRKIQIIGYMVILLITILIWGFMRYNFTVEYYYDTIYVNYLVLLFAGVLYIVFIIYSSMFKRLSKLIVSNGILTGLLLLFLNFVWAGGEYWQWLLNIVFFVLAFYVHAYLYINIKNKLVFGIGTIVIVLIQIYFVVDITQELSDILYHILLLGVPISLGVEVLLEKTQEQIEIAQPRSEEY